MVADIISFDSIYLKKKSLTVIFLYSTLLSFCLVDSALFISISIYTLKPKHQIYFKRNIKEAPKRNKRQLNTTKLLFLQRQKNIPAMKLAGQKSFHVLYVHAKIQDIQFHHKQSVVWLSLLHFCLNIAENSGWRPRDNQNYCERVQWNCDLIAFEIVASGTKSATKITKRSWMIIVLNYFSIC